MYRTPILDGYSEQTPVLVIYKELATKFGLEVSQVRSIINSFYRELHQIMNHTDPLCPLSHGYVKNMYMGVWKIQQSALNRRLKYLDKIKNELANGTEPTGNTTSNTERSTEDIQDNSMDRKD